MQWCHVRHVRSKIDAPAAFAELALAAFPSTSVAFDPSAIANIFHSLSWTTRKWMEDWMIRIKIHGSGMEKSDISSNVYSNNFIASRSLPPGNLRLTVSFWGLLPGDFDEWIYSKIAIVLPHSSATAPQIFELPSHTQATNLPTKECIQLLIHPL